MRYKAHLAMGVFIGISLRNNTPSLLPLLGSIIGSLAPDIDTEMSMISLKFPTISARVRKITGHRELTHAPLLPIAFMLLLPGTFGAGFSAGYAGHLLQDLFTLGGIPLYYPLRKERISLLSYKTGERDALTTFFMICIMGLVFVRFRYY